MNNKSAADAKNTGTETMQKVYLRVEGAIFRIPDHEIGFMRTIPIFKGWVVRKKGATDFHGEDGMYEAMKEALETTKAVSGTKIDELEVWDVVEIFDNEEDATMAGIRNEQQAIYQIETGRLKWLH